MPKRNDKPQADQRLRAQAASLSPDALSSESSSDSLSPELALRGLEQIIEAERGQLLQAYSVLKCVYEVLLYADHENSLHHADATHLAAQLIDGVAERLDLVNLRARLAQMREELDAYPDSLPESIDHEGVRDRAWAAASRRTTRMRTLTRSLMRTHCTH